MAPLGVPHVAYSDEASYNVGRFRGVAAVSLRVEHEAQIAADIQRLLAESSVRELAWKKLTSARDRLAAEKVLGYVVDLAKTKRLRVDALLWDTHDSRHAVLRRDDTANLGRMYHHLFVVLFRQRWPDEAVWTVHPDEGSYFAWEQWAEFLRGKAIIGRRVPGELFRRMAVAYHVDRVEAVSSASAVLVQVADVMAGLGLFSRESFDRYERWCQEQTEQSSLLSPLGPGQWSHSQVERFQLLRSFDVMCKAAKMGVSLRSNRYLWTRPLPGRWINFWWWEPQHEADKAPTREHDL
jgi:hypothetical protein